MPAARRALPELDRLLHERVRLGIASALAANESLSFNELKALLGTTDGNLSVHARKLEEAGYVSCAKTFAGRLPKTDYRLTAAGRRAFEKYLGTSRRSSAPRAAAEKILPRNFMSQSYMPELAPLMFLVFLGTAAALAVVVLAAAAAAACRRWTLAKIAVAAGLLLVLLYAAGLLALSLRSEEKTLALRDRKYFCEVDCHLAYSVEEVRIVPAAAGTRWLVRLRAWFDRNTIASLRGDAPLGPNPRVAWVVDERGTRYEIPEAALAPVEVPLRPGEAVETHLSVTLPAAVRRPRLFVGDPTGLERLIPGHENSPAHAKIYFALTPTP